VSAQVRVAFTGDREASGRGATARGRLFLLWTPVAPEAVASVPDSCESVVTCKDRSCAHAHAVELAHEACGSAHPRQLRHTDVGITSI
jgi:hypothetical protein